MFPDTMMTAIGEKDVEDVGKCLKSVLDRLDRMG